MRAIETLYRDQKYRSRLEARWAVAFDWMRIRKVYEKEGFNLGAAGLYLPDFWLPDVAARSYAVGIWVEIKPEGAVGDEDKYYALADLTGHPVILVGDEEFSNSGKFFEYGPGGQWDDLIQLMRCNSGHYKTEYGAESNYLTCERCGSAADPFHKSITTGLRKGLQSRFEHGANPAPPWMD